VIERTTDRPVTAVERTRARQHIVITNKTEMSQKLN